MAIVAVEDGGSTVYKYNVFANFVDLSVYIEKVTGATAGNFAILKADGSIEDTGVKASDFVAAEAGKGLSTNDYDWSRGANVDGAVVKYAGNNYGIIAIYSNAVNDFKTGIVYQFGYTADANL